MRLAGSCLSVQRVRELETRKSVYRRGHDSGHWGGLGTVGRRVDTPGTGRDERKRHDDVDEQRKVSWMRVGPRGLLRLYKVLT